MAGSSRRTVSVADISECTSVEEAVVDKECIDVGSNVVVVRSHADGVRVRTEENVVVEDSESEYEDDEEEDDNEENITIENMEVEVNGKDTGFLEPETRYGHGDGGAGVYAHADGVRTRNQEERIEEGSEEEEDEEEDNSEDEDENMEVNPNDALYHESNGAHVNINSHLEIDNWEIPDDVLLIPGISTIASTECILDCMKNYCGAQQVFRTIDSLEFALTRCKPRCKIFVGPGDHPISSLGVIGRFGGWIIGPKNAEAVISAETSDHVWLNILRSATVSVQNIVLTIDQSAEDTTGPGVGIFVQGVLHVKNVLLTRNKLEQSQSGENTSTVTGIEMTTSGSLHLIKSTIKHFTIGLITQTGAETEVHESGIEDCAIGVQSSIYAKNFIRSLRLTRCSSYAFLVDSQSMCGESDLDHLKEEDSFYIEKVEINECGMDVYFVLEEVEA